jgi:CRP/FNR family nitrogen fixation transcriptional regulator
MNANGASLHISERTRTHERAESHRSIPTALDALAVASRFQRDEEIYPQQGSVGCWYRVISGAARRFILRADGRRQTVDLLLPGDFFGFGVRGMHAFTAEAIVADTVIARYPASRIETLAASDARAARELSGIVVSAMSRLHSLLLILGRTTAEQKVGSFLLHMQERVGSGAVDRLTLPVTRYDVADYLALSVETVSRALTGLKERGVISLSGPRKIGIIDRDALENECDADEALETFASADDFLASGRLSETACLVLDVQMPGLNGLELQSRLVAEGHQVPIIFITAFSDENARAQALKAGALCYLVKPFEEADL